MLMLCAAPFRLSVSTVLMSAHFATLATVRKSTKQEKTDALDLFGTIAPVEPTREEIVRRELSRYGVGHDCVRCDKWLISGEETFVNNDDYLGLMCLGCCLKLGIPTKFHAAENRYRAEVLGDATLG